MRMMRRVAMGLAVMLAGAVGATALGAGLAAEDAEQLRKAQQSYQAGEYAAAIETLEKLRERQPAVGEVHRLLGHSYAGLGRNGEARKSLLEAVGHGRLTGDVVARLASIDRDQQRDGALLQELRLMQVMEPENRAWKLLYAELLATTGAEEEAAHVFRTVLEAEPGATDALLQLANLELRRGRLAEAVKGFETAYHLGWDSPRLPEMIGDLWYELKDARQASAWYDRAAVSGGGLAAGVRLRHGRALLEAGDGERAKAIALELVGETDAKVTQEALVLLGRIALGAGETEEAVRWWQQAADAGLEEPQVLAFVGAHHFNQGRWAEAAGYLARRLAQGEDGQVRRHLVSSLLRAGKVEEAGEALGVYLEHHGLDESARGLIGQWSAARNGQAAAGGGE